MEVSFEYCKQKHYEMYDWMVEHAEELVGLSTGEKRLSGSIALVMKK